MASPFPPEEPSLGRLPIDGFTGQEGVAQYKAKGWEARENGRREGVAEGAQDGPEEGSGRGGTAGWHEAQEGGGEGVSSGQTERRRRWALSRAGERQFCFFILNCICFCLQFCSELNNIAHLFCIPGKVPLRWWSRSPGPISTRESGLTWRWRRR